MKKVLAITVALMIAAIVLTPALGYTNQAAGNQSYTAKSGSLGDYSFKSAGVPAHNLTPAMVANKHSFKAPAVQSNRVPYSFKQGSAMPYSMKLNGVDNAVAMGYQTKKGAALLGSMNKASATITATPAVETTPVETVPVANTTVPDVEPAPVEQPMFSIDGVVFDDANGNGVMDNNETGMVGWTVNIEQPAGTVINNVTTDNDGKFAFMDLAAGEYIVSEVIQMGWNLISPAEGKFTQNIINESATNLIFANQVVPAAPANLTA
jgi:hypothetical protein